MARLTAFCFLPLVLILGCSKEDGDRSHVTGNITFKGVPVAAGQIDFLPDPVKNSSGSQGFAPIKAGSYDTRQGRGTSGGAMMVRITGHDGNPTPDSPLGKVIFIHEEPLDLQPGSGPRDFVVPPDAAKNVGKHDPV